jgi:hypothetical protein
MTGCRTCSKERFLIDVKLEDSGSFPSGLAETLLARSALTGERTHLAKTKVILYEDMLCGVESMPFQMPGREEAVRSAVKRIDTLSSASRSSACGFRATAPSKNCFTTSSVAFISFPCGIAVYLDEVDQGRALVWKFPG